MEKIIVQSHRGKDTEMKLWKVITVIFILFSSTPLSARIQFYPATEIEDLANLDGDKLEEYDIAFLIPEGGEDVCVYILNIYKGRRYRTLTNDTSICPQSIEVKNRVEKTWILADKNPDNTILVEGEFPYKDKDKKNNRLLIRNIIFIFAGIIIFGVLLYNLNRK